MRALKPAHDELIKAGFLQEVSAEGRGKTKVLHYVFRDVQPLVDPEAVATLVKHKITGGRAIALAQKHKPAEIHRAVGVLGALMKTDYRSRIRNPAGFLSDVLEHPDKYDTYLSAQKEAGGKATEKKTKVSKASQEAEQELIAAPLPRNEKSARVVLMGQLDDTKERRALRDRAIRLYMNHRVGTFDLVEMLKLQESEMVEWLERLERA